MFCGSVMKMADGACQEICEHKNVIVEVGLEEGYKSDMYVCAFVLGVGYSRKEFGRFSFLSDPFRELGPHLRRHSLYFNKPCKSPFCLDFRGPLFLLPLRL